MLIAIWLFCLAFINSYNWVSVKAGRVSTLYIYVNSKRFSARNRSTIKNAMDRCNIPSTPPLVQRGVKIPNRVVCREILFAAKSRLQKMLSSNRCRPANYKAVRRAADNVE